MNKPVAAYQGSEPYIFVCYAHADAEAVYADLIGLQGQEIRVWYDEGITAGSSWRAEIAGAIKGAQRFIFFISAASLQSSHCLREVDYALHHDIDIVPVYLEDCALPAELELVLNRVQALFRYRDSRYMEHLLEAVQDKGLAALVPRTPKSKRRLKLSLLAAAAVALLATILLQWPESQHLAPGTPARVETPTAYDVYLEGQKLVERWDHGDNLVTAIDLFRKAAGLDPDFALAYARLADALRLRYAISGDEALLEEAVSYAAEAQRLNADLAPVQVALGRIQLTQGNVDLAFASLNKALAIDPNDAGAHQAMAKVYERQGRLEDAEASFRKAVALDPDSLLFRDSYANFLYRQTRYHEAADQWRAVIRFAPDHYGALVNLGSALSEIGEVAESITMYERAIQIRPSYMAYANLGTAYGRAKRYPKAVEALQKALEIDATDWLAWGNLGYAYSWSGEADGKAEESFRHAIELAETARQQTPRDPLVNSDLGLYYAKTGQGELAMQRIETALALAPESGEVLAAAAEVYELSGQRERAVALVNQSIGLGLPRQRFQRNPEFASLLEDPRMQSPE